MTIGDSNNKEMTCELTCEWLDVGGKLDGLGGLYSQSEEAAWQAGGGVADDEAGGSILLDEGFSGAPSVG